MEEDLSRQALGPFPDSMQRGWPGLSVSPWGAGGGGERDRRGMLATGPDLGGSRPYPSNPAKDSLRICKSISMEIIAKINKFNHIQQYF